MAEGKNDVELVVRARTVLDDAQKKIGGFLDEIEKKTETTGKKTKGLGESIRGFYQNHEESFKSAAKAAGIFVGVVAGVAAGIVALGRRGAAIDDVSQQFRTLSGAIGNTADAMITELRAGVVGTLSDFELMKLANKALGTGLQGSAEDFGVLAAGARLAAKRVGGDTKQAFEQLTTAIASGSATTLRNMGILVDQKRAVEEYAVAQGKLSAQITDADRVAAIQQETIRVLRGELELTTLGAADFGERIDQIQVRMTNWIDNLALSISRSEVLGAAMGSLGDAVFQALGDDNQEQIRIITDLVNQFAIGITTAAQVALTGAKWIGNAFYGLRAILFSVLAVIGDMSLGVSNVIASTLEWAAKLPGVGSTFAGMAANMREQIAETQGWRDSFVDTVDQSLDSAGRLNSGIEAMQATLGRTKAEMIRLAQEGPPTAEALDEVAGGAARTARETGLLTSDVAKLEAQLKSQRSALQSLGLVTVPQLNEELDKLQALEDLARREGIDAEVAARALEQKYRDLAKAARDSGIDVSGVTEKIAELRRTMGDVPDMVDMLIPPDEMLDRIKAAGVTMTGVEFDVWQGAQRIEHAYESLGITTQRELDAAARVAREAYRTIAESGTASHREIEEARTKLLEAEAAAAGQSVGFWQSQIGPGILGVWGDVRDAAKGTFAEMILDTKGFREGFGEIWESIEAGFKRTVARLLQTFVDNLLGGMLNALAGRQGAFSGLLGGMFGVGGGGLPGGGLGAPGGTEGGFGAGGFGGFTGGLMGAGVGGLAGFGIGSRFGTGRGVLGGIGSGAASGFMFGGPIGAGIGAIGGAIGGFIGGRKNTTKEGREAFVQSLGFGSLDDLMSEIGKELPERAAELRHEALNVIGKKDEAANLEWMDQVVAALDEGKRKVQALAGEAASLGLTWEHMGPQVRKSKLTELFMGLHEQSKRLTEEGYEYEAVLTAQAGAWSELYAKSEEYGVEVPGFLYPVLQQLVDMGLLVDRNGDKVEKLGEEFAGALGGAQSDQEKLNAMMGDLGLSAEASVDAIQAAFDRLNLEIPVTFGDPGTFDPGVVPPDFSLNTRGAASGGLYSRPTIRVIAETKPEVVGAPDAIVDAFVQALRRAGAGGGAGGGLTIQVHAIDGDHAVNILRRAVRSGLGDEITDWYRTSGAARVRANNALAQG